MQKGYETKVPPEEEYKNYSFKEVGALENVNF